MPSAFKRRLPAVGAPGAAPAAGAPQTTTLPGGAGPASSPPPRSTFPSGHAILDGLLPQGGPVRLLLPAPHLGHARPLAAHELPAAHAAAAHAASLALLGAGRALADGERVLVMAPQLDEARSWAARIPAPPPAASGSNLGVAASAAGASGSAAGASGQTASTSGSATTALAAARSASDESSLGSAVRYAHLVPQLAARGVPSGGSGGEALLDLARPLGAGRARELEAQGTLRCVALADGSGEADAVRVLRDAQQDGAVHAVLLHAGAALDGRALFRQLLGLRGALHAASSLTLLLSPHWLAQCSPAGLSRLLSLADTALCLSVFAAPLAEAFPAYTGALRCAVQRAPPGRLVCAAPPELGYRARRRGIGVGLLHLDVGGGVGERRTKPAPARDDIEEAGSSLARKGVAHGHVHTHEDTHVHAAEPEAVPSPPPVEATPKLTGLAALRARGAQKRAEAAAAAAAAGESNT